MSWRNSPAVKMFGKALSWQWMEMKYPVPIGATFGFSPHRLYYKRYDDVGQKVVEVLQMMSDFEVNKGHGPRKAREDVSQLIVETILSPEASRWVEVVKLIRNGVLRKAIAFYSKRCVKDKCGARVIIPNDVKKKPWEQELPLHNRWHPEIPPVAEVAEGEVFRVEMVDANGGVRFPGLNHPGIVGTAPSMELLHVWNEREKKLQEEGLETLKLCEVLHSRPLAELTINKRLFSGMIKQGSPEWEWITKEAARTIPGRENGGNCDIKNLSRGSKIYLPVFIEGANLSTGDMHFSQGDGEISYCGAIEMSGFLELKCEIIRGRMKEYLTPMGPTPLHVNPIFEIGPVEPRFAEWLVFEGISVDESRRQHYLDATVAYKRAVLNAIDYLSKFGYSKEQMYLLLSCCPCEGRISGIVDSPNALATFAIPTAIFDQDIHPKSKIPVGPRVVRKPDVLKCTYDGNLPITKNLSATR
ncbi:hypothetical protein CRG98_008296 [Punica granatum]|uniref:Formamidase-like n=1 Tax=Punica granatum TaxID=22663 RepID=A0A2I0KTW4_PUNGR|nr:hypothetical protein CRG98_008296 [Punica granatum]